VAQVLGWQNLLPVTSGDGRFVRGPWGRLRAATAPGAATPDWVAVRPDGPHFVVADGLPADVVRVADMGGYAAVWCRLAHGSLLRIHACGGAPCPAPDTRARLRVPVEAVVPLPTRAPPPAIEITISDSRGPYDAVDPARAE
jgi:molybdate transport system ATP-binding protein